MIEDVWEKSDRVHKGDEIRAYDAKQKDKEQFERIKKQSEYAAKMRAEKERKSFKNKMKRFFLGNYVNGKREGFAFLRRDLAHPVKSVFRRRGKR